MCSSGARIAERRVLDVAFAWSVMNSHFGVADFLFDHGAGINMELP